MNGNLEDAGLEWLYSALGDARTAERRRRDELRRLLEEPSATREFASGVDIVGTAVKLQQELLRVKMLRCAITQRREINKATGAE